MAQYYTCSKFPEHQSIDADYCSMCGTKIAGAASALPPVDSLAAVMATSAGVPSMATTCPDCGTPRAGSAKFCEICRYNYETGAPASPVAPPPIAAPVIASTNAPQAAPVIHADPPAPVSVIPTPLTSPIGGGSWELVVTVDPSLYVEPDPNIPCPANEPERTFPIDFAENLIGRRSDRKDIHPEIPLTDPGVSHRHAKILRQADGSYVLLDVGSTNGTHLNGNLVAEGVRTALSGGDEITLGCWTRLRLQRTVS